MKVSGAASRRVTEAEILTLLRARYTQKAGNGEAFAFVPHVRNAAGFDATRTIDAVAMALWPSRGLILEGIEVKSSRADWLRELRNPAKAEGFASLVDRWWVAVADESIVEDGELPEGWGLFVVRGSRLVCRREAQLLHSGAAALKTQPLPPGFGRSSLAALLRSACRVAAATPAEVQEAADAARAEERRRWEDAIARLRGDVEEHRARERRFAEVAGVPLTGWWGSSNGVDQVAAAVRAVMQGDAKVASIERQLQTLRDSAERLLEAADRELAALPEEVA